MSGCFFFVTLATVFVGVAPEANLIWVANGVILAYLLLAPRKRWPAYLGVAYIAQFTGGMLVGHHGIVSGLFLTLLNVCEPLVSALFLRRRTTEFPDFTRPAYIARFLLYGVLAGPALLGAIDAVLSPIWHTASPLWHTASRGSEFLQWFTADALGVCVATPACVAFFRARIRASLFSFRHCAYLLPVLACAIAAFCQARFPMPFLIYPLLILVLLRLTLGWAALATLLVAGIASYFTVRGQGPFAISNSIGPIESAVLVQVYIAAAMAVLYGISVFLGGIRTAEGHRNLVSAASTNWSGWSQEEMLHLNSLSLVHPTDQPIMAQTVSELRAGRDDALVECRVRTRNDEYVWVEASLHTIRHPRTGVPTGILNNVREITQRKMAEQQLAEAYRAVEELAITDALTGLANRRRFDQYLTTEWRRGMRERNPLSLVLIDADLFKSYNDTYGHLRGDNCLKQIAEAIQDVVSRPGDLVARFGGEEFAVVLPNTTAPGGLQVAEEICAAMRNRQLPHSGNPVGVVTISAGSATLVPQLGQHAASLIDSADKALYEAKGKGRNCACAYQSGAADKSAVEINQDLIALKTA
jgi:diguanylate cyclase (GGDEF)-like protein/PAS domain S-box-containing protein